MKKYFSLESLSPLLDNLKKKGKRIVLANGCFDLIHIGHVRYLEEARKKGDILVLALNSDSSVKKIKGDGRPLMKEEERAFIVSSFSCVDYVLIFEETDVSCVLTTLKPHIHAKGSDYTPETVPERDIVLGYGGEIAITGGPKVRSTSEIIQDIQTRHHPFNHKKNS